MASQSISVTQKTYSMKGRLCPYISSEGVCPYIEDCVYSHTIEEARGHNLNFKTKICEFAANGYCAKANECRYAHSFSELVSSEESTPEGRLTDQLQVGGRNVSSVSTIDATHSLSGSDWEESPITHRPRVCYVAPMSQRSVIQNRQKRIIVPSSFHYVEQLEQRKQALLPAPMIAAYDGYYHYPCVYGHPIIYNLGIPDVLYED